jgi:mRNA interferase RelE/StbE
MAKPKKNRPKRPNPPDADGPRADANAATPRSYEIHLTSAAVRALDRLTRADFRQVDAKLRPLAEDPRPTNCKKLQGMTDVYRIRAGNHRIIYQINDGELLIIVVDVGDRKDVYRNL